MAVRVHKDRIEQLKQQFPNEWACAHTGKPCTEDFIRIAAFVINQDDPDVGLNGKRGDPNNISDDALSVKDPEGCDTDPTEGGSRRSVVDVIVGAGGSNPQPAYNVVSDCSQPTGSAWVEPPVPAGWAGVASPTLQAPALPAPPSSPAITKEDFLAVMALVANEISALTAALGEIAIDAEIARNDANVAAESALRIEDQLKRGFIADLGARFIGGVKGPIVPKDK